MDTWQKLVTSAVIGTERRSVEALAAPAKLGAVLAQRDLGNQEKALLDAVAAVALYRRAGHIAQSDPPAEPAGPCPPDSVPECGEHATYHLSQMIGGQYRELLPEWLGALAHADCRVPAFYLPALLELGRNQTNMRPHLLPVIGQRGSWLARQNPEWRYAWGGAYTEDARSHTAVWETSERTARVTLLHQLRRTQPSEARELVESTWNEEKADDRAAFLGALEENVSLDDQPFLEAALDDRSKEVRRVAADLLSRLPGSQLVQRMIARVKPLITLKKRLLRAPIIEVQLPDTCDKAMVRDGIEPKPPGKLGEKAWWLQQMLAIVPPALWSKQWNMPITEVLEVVAQSEWREVFATGWLSATERHKDVAWAEAFLLAGQKLPVEAPVETLISVLPQERREAFVMRAMAENAPLAPALLRQCTHTWSIPFARAVVRWVRLQIEREKRAPSWMLLSLFKECALYVPPTLAAEFAKGWPTETPTWQSWQGSVERFLLVLQFRNDMLAGLGSDD
jgi:hypothetical protein